MTTTITEPDHWDLARQDWACLTLAGGEPNASSGRYTVRFRRNFDGGSVYEEIYFEYVPSDGSAGFWDVRSNTTNSAVGQIGRYEPGVFANCPPTEETIADLFDRVAEANREIAKIKADLTADAGDRLFVAN